MRFVYVVVFLRLIFAPVIFVSFEIAVFATFILDWIDGEIFKRAGLKRSVYSLWDKVLDYYWYIFIIIFLYNHHSPNFLIFFYLFFLRSFGQFFFFITRSEFFLFLFPNIFEILFYCYLFTIPFPQFITLINSSRIFILLGIITPLTFLREYLIHIKRINLSWIIFGKTTHWIAED
ncbi:hypothetical protein M1116_01585 [Patescibacteria group bacterium]|nr:hypothetical protein [Patescibacteria group bacterium]